MSHDAIAIKIQTHKKAKRGDRSKAVFFFRCCKYFPSNLHKIHKIINIKKKNVCLLRGWKLILILQTLKYVDIFLRGRKRQQGQSIRISSNFHQQEKRKASETLIEIKLNKMDWIFDHERENLEYTMELYYIAKKGILNLVLLKG